MRRTKPKPDATNDAAGFPGGYLSERRAAGKATWAPIRPSTTQYAIFLQVKEARKSVLEPYAGKSLHPNQGDT
jgi:hypothetical protein